MRTTGPQDYGPRTTDHGLRTKDQGPRTWGTARRWSEVRGQRSEVRGQRSEVRGQRSEIRGFSAGYFGTSERFQGDGPYSTWEGWYGGVPRRRQKSGRVGAGGARECSACPRRSPGSLTARQRHVVTKPIQAHPDGPYAPARQPLSPGVFPAAGGAAVPDAMAPARKREGTGVRS